MARPASRSIAQRGLTLVELMVALTIGAILIVAAGPSFTDYLGNAHLRENGNTVYAAALLAQSEAIKRNTTVRLDVDGATVQVVDRSDPDDPLVLRTDTLTHGVSAGAVTVDFAGEGRTVNLAAASIDLASAAHGCTGDVRCPGLRIDGGGAIRFCGNHLSGCE